VAKIQHITEWQVLYGKIRRALATDYTESGESVFKEGRKVLTDRDHLSRRPREVTT
jgi:hypothetical protein